MNTAEASFRLLRFILRLLAHTPFRVLYALSDGMFYLLYYVVRYRRKVVRRNLTESFPDKTLHEIKHTEKACSRFFTDMTLESCKLATISKE